MRLDEAQRAFARLMRARNLDAATELAQITPPEAGGTSLREMLDGLTPLLTEHYQDLIRGSLWGALDRCYLQTARVMGDEWLRACRTYLETYPPAHWDLNRTVLKLPEFLEEQWEPANGERLPWLHELADYERLELEVFLYEDPGNRDEQQRATLHLPRLNPTMRIQLYTHDIAGWVRARDDGDAPPAPAPGDTITAFYRDPDTLECRFLNINALTAFVCQSWQEGTPSPVIAGALAPQLELPPEQCLAQLEQLARSLAAARAVDIGPDVPGERP